MLEKMGWSKGKGLGAKEDGSQDFVRVRYKNDSQGLGYEQRDDQWTQHESSFNVLLKNLNGDETVDDIPVTGGGSGNKSSSEEDEISHVGFGFQADEKPKPKKSKLKEKISGISLEERSKQSKARVHYKKFTKGKDLSQYSEKDLANIFGKKADDEQQALYAQMNDQFNGADQNEGKAANEMESFAGVQTISTGLSVSDYFKMKMASLKNKSGHTNGHRNEDKEDEEIANNTMNDHDTSTKKKKKKRDKTVESEQSELQVEMEKVIPASDPDTENKCESKKHKENSKQLNEDKTEVAKNEISNSASMRKINKKKDETLENKEKTPVTSEKYSEIEDNQSHVKIASKKRKHEDTTTNVLESTQKSKTVNGEVKRKKDISEDKTSSDVNASNPESKSLSEIGKDVEEKREDKRTSSKRTRDFCEQNLNLETIALLSLTELEEKLKSFNVFKMSTFAAEKFRNVDLNYFPNSTLPQVEGYGFNQNIELIVENNKKDARRINNLWSDTLCKYANLEKPIKTYRSYVKDCIKARKFKQPKPKLKVKKWKRKDAFSLV